VGTCRWYVIAIFGGLCVSALFLCTACVPNSNQEQSLRQIQSQIAVLSNEMQESFVKSGDDRIGLYKQLNEDIKLLQKNQADASVISDELRASLQVIDAKLDEYNDRMEKLNERLSSTETTMTERINLLSDQVSEIMSNTGISPGTSSVRREPPVSDMSAGQPPVAPTPAPSEPTPTPSQQEMDQEATQLYHTAYMAYINGNFDAAIAGFKKYLEFYPNTKFAAISQYWIAESYFSLGEFETALKEYDKLIGLYPDSDKVPAAYFSKADVYLKLDRQIEAISHLKYIVNQFPQSSVARKAKERLQALGQE
jgi:tol-pal system protein YbgF